MAILIVLQSVFPQKGIFIADAPTNVIHPDSTATILLSPLPPVLNSIPGTCRLQATTITNNNSDSAMYPRIIVSSSTGNLTRSYSFKPSSPLQSGESGLQSGIHYLRIFCDDNKYWTQEIPLIVGTGRAAVITEPKNEVSGYLPVISWEPVTGVPAYHLLLSDQPIQIDAGSGSVSGASIAWQAITNKPSIRYGTPDPSGNFDGIPAPPLSPGISYTLVVLNNYDGKSPLTSSTLAQGVKIFRIKDTRQSETLFKPKALLPAKGDTLNSSQDSIIEFHWTDSIARANSYRLFIYENKQQNGQQALVPVWEGQTSDTLLSMRADRVLGNGNYKWKVFAEGTSGKTISGDTSSFNYRSLSATLKLKAWTNSINLDTTWLPGVEINVNTLSGNTVIFPIYTLGDSAVSLNLPQGIYQLQFAFDGYRPQTIDLNLNDTSTINLNLKMLPSPVLVSGGFIDTLGNPVSQVKAVFQSQEGQWIETLAGANGEFKTGLEPGLWTLNPVLQGWSSKSNVQINVSAGSNKELGAIVLYQNSISLSGTIRNSEGSSIINAKVTVLSENNLPVANFNSDDKGAFRVLLRPGNYLVKAEKPGFSSSQSLIRLSQSKSVELVLKPGASIIRGIVNAESRISASVSVSSPVIAASVSLFDSARSLITSTTTNPRGEFSFSAGDTGIYLLQANAGKGFSPESAWVHVPELQSSLDTSLNLLQSARINGTIFLTPPNPQSERATASVFRFSDGGYVTGSRAEILNDSMQTYEISGLADGTYRVSSGLPGYGLKQESFVQINNGIWSQAPRLDLIASNIGIRFMFFSGDSSIEGSVQIRSPFQQFLNAGTRLYPAGFGNYTIEAYPASARYLPLTNYGFRLDSTFKADTTISLTFPFYHNQNEIKVSLPSVTIPLITDSVPDSVRMIYGWGKPEDTLTVAVKNSQRQNFNLNVGNSGGVLVYWFEAFYRGQKYSNLQPGRRFEYNISPSKKLAYLEFNRDSLLSIAPGATLSVKAEAFGWASNPLSDSVQIQGKVQWRITGDKAVSLESDSTLATVITAQSQMPDSRGFNDTLWIKVTLNNDSVIQKVVVKVRKASANLLIVSPLLSSPPVVEGSERFQVITETWDTTLIPRIRLTAEPVISLLPEGSGTIKGNTILPSSDFIGPMKIRASLPSYKGDSIFAEGEVLVDRIISPENPGLSFRYGSLAEIVIPENWMPPGEMATLRLSLAKLTSTQRNPIREIILGQAFRLENLEKTPPAQPIDLLLKIPDEVTERKNRIGVYDPISLAWEPIPDSSYSSASIGAIPAMKISVDSVTGNVYTIISQARELSTRDLNIIPNPFSPRVTATRDGNSQPGARIVFQPESNQSGRVIATIEVYNLAGEKIRTVINRQTLPKQTAEFYWDGKTDSGKQARNGRYRLLLILEEIGGKARYVTKPVVVFQ